MSITTVRNIIEKPGCYIGASVVMLLGIIGGSFTQCGRGGGNQNQPTDGGKPAEVPIAQLGNYKITADEFEKGVAQALQQNQGQPLTPDSEGQVRGRILSQYITNGVLSELLKKHNVTVTDGQIADAVKAEIDQKLDMERMRLMISHELSSNATQKEVDDYFRSKVGKTPKEIENEELASTRENLKDPAMRAGIAPSVGFQSLTDAEAKKITPTDEQIKKGFQSFTFKKILITPKTAGGIDPTEKAKKVLAEIKAGMSFDSAMDKYSDDQPAPKKQIHDNRDVQQYETLAGVPLDKPLLGLKPGEVSPIIPAAGGAAIYKLVEVKANVPKEFVKNRAQYANEFALAEARRQLNQELTNLRKEAKIDWKSPAYQALYDFNTAANDPDIDKAGRAAIYKRVVDEAKKETNPMFKRTADLMVYLASSSLYAASSPDEQKKLTDNQIQAMTQVLQSYESPDIRVRLAEAYADKKDGANTFTQLLTAAQRNSSIDAAGQFTFNKINSDVAKFQKQGTISADQSKQIADVFEIWRKQYTAKLLEDQKQAAEKAKFEKQQADAQKKAIADQKRVTAEQKKASQNQKPGTPPVPGTSVQPDSKKGK